MLDTVIANGQVVTPQGAGAWDAATAGAWLHGTAAEEGPARGLVASDVVAGLPAVIARLAGEEG